MIWENASYLWLLLLLPLLAAGIWWYGKRIRRKREDYFSEELFEKLQRGFWALGERIQSVSLFIGLFCLIVAMAGPKIGTEVREVNREGVDLLIALDLSASMNAEDVRPNRLEKAKFEISRLVDNLDGDRVGLLVFTGEAYLQAPMTLDYSALRLFLDIADTDQMPGSSTDFTEAMETALQAFDTLEEDSSSDASKVLLFVSDGEHHGESYSDVINKFIENNISIYTIGIGSRDGARIPVYDSESDERIGFKRDNDGQEVQTRLEADVLQDIADRANGRYYEIRSGSGNIDSFLGRLDELQKGEFASQEYADYKNQYQWLAGFGLLFLVVSLLVPNYRKKNHKFSFKND